MLNTVNLNDAFWTIQGEGFNSGRRALFLRLPFCNLKCSWCDTEFNSFNPYPIEQLEKFALSEKARFAVITGGEPTMNKQFPALFQLMKKLKFDVAVESNGTFNAPDGDYWLTVSPKREQKIPYFITESAMMTANEFKYVVDKDFDFSILDRHNQSWAHKYLSPEFSDFHGNLNKIYDYIKENPTWKISLQTHKWMNIK